jgi:hypothetical protein
MPESANPFGSRDGPRQPVVAGGELVQQVRALFNPGEYDPSLARGIGACADGYLWVLVYARNTVHEIRQYHTTRAYEADLAFINESPPPRMSGIYQLSCPGVRASFQALLIALQSLLDLLCEHLLSYRTSQSVLGFHRAGGVAGGNVLGVLKHITLRTGRPRYEQLANLILTHKTEWIDDVVSMRENAVRTGELPNFLGFWITREAGRVGGYTPADIQEPALHLGERAQRLSTYCQRLPLQAQLFTVDFRDLLFPPREREATLARARRGGIRG